MSPPNVQHQVKLDTYMIHPQNTITPGRYRHYKGNKYEVIGIAHDSETQEPHVVYRALYGEYGLWIRPFSMFTETVQHNGETVPRFLYISDA